MSNAQKPVSAGLRADAQRNRLAIIAVATRVFQELGVSASLERIAREASVAIGTLYRHFPTRDAILAAVLEGRSAELLGTAEYVRDADDAGDALQTWIVALHDYLTSFSGLSDPVLNALEQEDSPLSLNCKQILDLTGLFLGRAQARGQARSGVTAKSLFQAILGAAWVGSYAKNDSASKVELLALIQRGYLLAGSA